jgi:hypothetical protein
VLRALSMKNVGPAEEMTLDPLGTRLNLIAGDNGLGKSFLLELAWWTLTGAMGNPAITPARPGDAWIEAYVQRRGGGAKVNARWEPRAATWLRSRVSPGQTHPLVVYARADGEVWLWDPLRNLGAEVVGGGEEVPNPKAYFVGPRAAMEGLRRTIPISGVLTEQTLCSGLIHDWVDWQRSGDPRFEVLCRTLSALSPTGAEIRPGEPTALGRQDVRLMPTVVMPYDLTVPLIFAPAGVLSVARLAYLLTWFWAAHDDLAARLGVSRAPQLVVLLDEPETHLHPRWQRTYLPSLLRSLQGGGVPKSLILLDEPEMHLHPNWQRAPVAAIEHALNGVGVAKVQLLVATHSPLVLASMEPHFDEAQDALWKLDLTARGVEIARDHWHLRGNVSAWLRSDVFDLGDDRSVEAEAALAAAARLIGAPGLSRADALTMSQRLLKLLNPNDPRYLSWRHHMRHLLDDEAAP